MTNLTAKLEDFPRRTQVTDSSMITAVMYNANNEEMLVRFVDGDSIYIYHGVSQTMHGAIVSADSVGKAFSKMVRKNEGIKYDKLI